MKLLRTVSLLSFHFTSLISLVLGNSHRSSIHSKVLDVLTIQEYRDLTSHGCWCKNIDVDGVWVGSSRKIDQLDSQCSRWFTMRSCVSRSLNASKSMYDLVDEYFSAKIFNLLDLTVVVEENDCPVVLVNSTKNRDRFCRTELLEILIRPRTISIQHLSTELVRSRAF